MDNQNKAVVNLELDIADFSGKIVNRIDLKSVVSRSDPRKAGIAIIMSFTDGATGTILVRSGGVPIIPTPYVRPKLDSYTVEDYDAVAVAVALAT
jgi:hypothetical protein